MNCWQRVQREAHLWRQYPTARLRWLLAARRLPLGAETFTLSEVHYPYFIHPYNHTWTNERAVELPPVLQRLQASDPALTLEIGNVLSHYTTASHTVVDLFERCRYRRIINQDLLDYHPGRQFQTIVSISTIEHVGWDETPRREDKVITAFTHIQALLAPGGQALITIPAGYNHHLDRFLRDWQAPGVSLACLKRIDQANHWEPTTRDEALKQHYNHPFVNANAMIFITMRKDGAAQPQ